MARIAVLGAGELGGSIVHVLARRDIVSTIHLIDETGRVAEGKALDIMQAAPIEQFATRVTGSTQLIEAAGAELILVADQVAGGEWQDEPALRLLDQVARFGGRRVVLCAGASQRPVIERGVRELKFDRHRLFGSAPEALAAAIRAVASVETRGSARDIALTVLGIPPSMIVVPWEEASISGFAAGNVLDPAARRRMNARIGPLWPPGPYTLAVAAAKVAAAIFGRSLQSVSAFVAPDDSNGRRSRAAALPVRLGPSGIVSVELPELNARDRVALENAMLL